MGVRKSYRRSLTEHYAATKGDKPELASLPPE
jgi:hypothetical protein